VSVTTGPREPLEQVTSIKVKLGLLVAASVLVAAVLATLGAGTVPAALSIPVTVLLALGVTQLLAVGMTSPLRQMTEAARRMAAGDYAVRVETSSTDEVGELARAFNRMAADLATVDRQRRDLVASVSHELRTPLTALVAVLENLDDGVTEADPATIRVALGQAERLSALVGDLLDLSRVDAGVVTLDWTDVPMAALVAESVAEARAGAREVSFDVLIEPADLVVHADRSRLHQLLANLLDNAARHSPAGGVVRVWAGRVGGLVRLEVSDEGAGILPADRERVFERFGTLQDPAGGGTGLGLAIARWVTDLHGGRIVLVDPVTGESGARFVVELPQSMHQSMHPSMHQPKAPPAPPERNHPMSTPMPAAPSMRRPAGLQSGSVVDISFGSQWPELDVRPRRSVLLACLGIGVFAGLSLPFADPGLAVALVLLASGMLVLLLTRHRSSPFTWACAALSAAFALMVVLRDAEWVVVLGLLTSALLTTSALTNARNALAMVLAAVAWPFAGLRGLPWLGRTLRSFGGGAASAALVRTVVLSALGVLVFGGLFASGDAIFGHWIDAVVPDIRGSLVLRLFVTVAVGGVVLAAAYLALNPPPVELARVRRPAQHRFEWLAPVLLVDAVFVLFMLAQAAAFFGGHDYIRRATGLTYAGYVHQGFAQLTIATALTLLVVWAASRKVGETAADRWWLRGSLGGLCLLTLVVVASALHRMDLYQDAYGFSRLRLLVDVFEGWLGLVVIAVMVAGIGLKGWWLPRMALLSGAALMLGLAVANPDAWIARHNIERYHATGKVDLAYLRGLSADATPTLATGPGEILRCTLGGESASGDSWAGWNLGRVLARRALDEVQPSVRSGFADPQGCAQLGRQAR
jgi:two-component system, OmpR family, sensor histidine kinase BaeS